MPCRPPPPEEEKPRINWMLGNGDIFVVIARALNKSKPCIGNFNTVGNRYGRRGEFDARGKLVLRGEQSVADR